MTLPPLQRSFAASPALNDTSRFAATLQTWHNPEFLAPLGHQVSDDGPAGMVSGIAHPAPPPEPELAPSSQPLTLRSPEPAPSRPTLQRSALASASASTPAAPVLAGPDVAEALPVDDGHGIPAAETAAVPADAVQRSSVHASPAAGAPAPATAPTPSAAPTLGTGAAPAVAQPIPAPLTSAPPLDLTLLTLPAVPTPATAPVVQRALADPSAAPTQTAPATAAPTQTAPASEAPVVDLPPTGAASPAAGDVTAPTEPGPAEPATTPTPAPAPAAAPTQAPTLGADPLTTVLDARPADGGAVVQRAAVDGGSAGAPLPAPAPTSRPAPARRLGLGAPLAELPEHLGIQRSASGPPPAPPAAPAGSPPATVEAWPGTTPDPATTAPAPAPAPAAGHATVQRSAPDVPSSPAPAADSASPAAGTDAPELGLQAPLVGDRPPLSDLADAAGPTETPIGATTPDPVAARLPGLPLAPGPTAAPGPAAPADLVAQRSALTDDATTPPAAADAETTSGPVDGAAGDAEPAAQPAPAADEATAPLLGDRPLGVSVPPQATGEVATPAPTGGADAPMAPLAGPAGLTGAVGPGTPTGGAQPATSGPAASSGVPAVQRSAPAAAPRPLDPPLPLADPSYRRDAAVGPLRVGTLQRSTGSAPLAPAPSATSRPLLSERPLALAAPPEPESVPAEVRDYVQRATALSVPDIAVQRGPESAAAATSLGAQAFTTGGQVHLPAEHGSTDSGPGRALLAHELAHAAQQQRLGDATPAEHTPEGQRLELQAQAVGAAAGPVVQRIAAPGAPVAGPAVQRSAAAPLPLATPAPSPGDVAVGSGLASRAADGSVVFPQPVTEETFVQRVEMAGEAGEAAAAPTSSTAPAAAPSGGGVAQSPAEIDALARKLYDPISARLKYELRLDRERYGMGSDAPY